MTFEFFFGLFGLISSDSKTRHKSRLEGDWRLFSPLSTSLFREATQKSPSQSSGNFKSSGGSSTEQSGSNQKSIFSSKSGILSATNNSEGVISYSASSLGSSSSGSISTINSTASLIKEAGNGEQLSAGINSKSGGKSDLNLLGEKILGRSNKIGDSGDRLSADLDVNSDEALEKGNDPGGKVGSGAESQTASGTSGGGKFGKRFREIYCRLVCLGLWLNVVRLLIGLALEKSILTLDIHYMSGNKIHFLIPAVCLAVQAAAVSSLFIRNNEETNWLVPFFSSKDYLIRSRSNFRPLMEDYKRRINISVGMALLLALISSLSLSAYPAHCIWQSEAFRSMFTATGSGSRPNGNSDILLPGANASHAYDAGSLSTSTTTTQHSMAGILSERLVLSFLLVFDTLWAIYSTFICFLVSFYFNLICSIMKTRFHGISKIIEDLAESNTRKTTNQARKITTFYLEHNEACELLDESNDFWQYLILFTYFTYIPAYCYCLYNLFFVDFEPWAQFITWVIHTHMGFIILLISFSAAGVSTEAHAPYTSLHTLSLIQLPLDVEVNITTFLHRVRGLTIGYSCYDLFAITNASMSNVSIILYPIRAAAQTDLGRTWCRFFWKWAPRDQYQTLKDAHSTSDS